MFSCEFCEISIRTPFFTEHLPWLLLYRHGSHIHQIYLVTSLHSFGDYWRKWWLVTEYWINFEMVSITIQPFLDSCNAYASVEPLHSRLYLSCTFPLKNLSTIPAEFQWNSSGVMENYWKMTGTNGTSRILLKFRWNSTSS